MENPIVIALLVLNLIATVAAATNGWDQRTHLARKLNDAEVYAIGITDTVKNNNRGIAATQDMIMTDFIVQVEEIGCHETR